MSGLLWLVSQSNAYQSRPVQQAEVRLCADSLFYSAPCGLQALKPGRPSPIVPNVRPTSADTLTTDVKTVCTAGYTAKVRNVTLSVRKVVFKAYGFQFELAGKTSSCH